MMEARRNVVAAITAAVELYLQAEQQQAAVIAPAPRKVPEPPRPVASPWAMAGRQSAMEIRRMWQMRLVH